jgi:hypothetical protein
MADPLCEECGDDGLRTLDPAYRGGPRRIAGVCDLCPRCVVCDTHARLEAEAIRRRQRRAARVPGGVESAGAPQLRLPLRPGLKKVRLPSADPARASGS